VFELICSAIINYCELWTYIVGGCKSTYCIMGYFSAQNFRMLREGGTVWECAVYIKMVMT
jgi:hypothetical protein